jgi:DNA-3-methyladenine glycosylase I
MIKRCTWCGNDPLYLDYHDKEWGVPLHDDRRLFEMLVLEGAQAGLSWLTILKKRNNYRQAFQQFDAEKIARYSNEDIQRLMQDAGIVRNRLKIVAAIKNAQGFLQITAEFPSFAHYLWDYVDHQPITNSWPGAAEIPTHSPISDRLSKDLKNRGFNFVGTTICYAFMQAVGMVNDHTLDCFRYHEITASSASRGRP